MPAIAGSRAPALAALLALLAPSLPAQLATGILPPPVQREFRGVWVASVANIDWPSRPGLPPCDQQEELLAILDRAVALRLNAVVLQVRPAGDALYASRLEPWSEFLTGTEGLAPSPWYDPLAFAVREAHARGLELHAWFNPYRARHPAAKSPLSASHVSRRMPSLVKSYGRYLWMDPGEPAIRRHTLNVVLDVVRRYDIDGVHIDDYFYPYQEYDAAGRLVDFPDERSWRRYRRGGGRLSRADWRRGNVDRLIRELHTGIHRVKPHVKFGISPFGVWRPGHPAQITGLDAYARLYADSRKWLRNGWVDYFTPQLYWPIAQTAQSYPVLLDWWIGENVKRRHLWPGNYTSRVGAARDQGWRATELLEQIRLTRERTGSSGNVHFSMKAFLFGQDSLLERLVAEAYSEPALVPASPWLDRVPPGRPTLRAVPPRDSSEASLPRLVLAAGKGGPPFLWAVRTASDSGAWTTTILPGTVRQIEVRGTTSRVVVSAVDRAGNESAPASLVLSAADND